MRRFFSRLHHALRPRHAEPGLERELRAHLTLIEDDLRRRGLSPAEAKVEARRVFGGVEQTKERHRDERGFIWIHDLRWDLSYALRMLLRAPGFTAVAVLTLAVGIGANAAIFTVVNALLLKPLPVPAPEQLARVKTGVSQTSWPNYEDLRLRTGAFSDLAAHQFIPVVLTEGAASIRTRGEAVSANFFSLLGVGARIGRVFTETSAQAGVVVLSDRIWKSRFRGDPGVLGRALVFGDRSFEVIGVMPPGFRGVAPPGLVTDVWIPVDVSSTSPLLRDRSVPQFEIVGRLKQGTRRQQALAAVRTVAVQMKREFPELPDQFVDVEVLPLDGFNAFDGMATVFLPAFAFLAFLTVVAGFVLLIGCANVAGLLIGRAVVRRREIAVRLALGAGRWRLIRQLLTESLLLASLGGAAGLVLSLWLTSAFNSLASRFPIPAQFDLQLDRAVLFYTGALVLFTALVFGLIPARRAARFELVSSLKDDGEVLDGRQRMRRWLVVGQVATCSALLVWSGIFLRSLGHVTDVDPGFDPNGVLIATMEFGRGSEERGLRILTDLQQRIRESPGVEAAGMSGMVPLALMGREEFYVSADRGSGPVRHHVLANRISPGWFETLRIPFLAGRDFAWSDRAGAPDVVVVNDTLARQFFGGDAIGRRLVSGKTSLEIVGVVRDSKYRTLGETSAPTVYLPFSQAYMWIMTLHVRTIDMKATADAIVRQLQTTAPGIVPDIEPMTQAVAAALLPSRIGAAATGVFGGVATLLAMLGVYGLVSFGVVNRTREIGIRKALGANDGDIVRLIVGGSVRSTVTGLALGLAAGATGAYAIRGFIVGVSPLDPVTLAGVAVVVVSTTVVASWLPARRGARLPAANSLRGA